MISKIVEYSIFLIFLFIPIALLFGTLVSESSMLLICLLFYVSKNPFCIHLDNLSCLTSANRPRSSDVHPRRADNRIWRKDR